VVGAENVLRLVAPAVLAAFFVGMFWRADFTRDVNRFAAEMDAGGFTYRTLLVVVLLESHG